MNLHKDKLSVLLKPGHYDIIYSKAYLEENPIIEIYDSDGKIQEEEKMQKPEEIKKPVKPKEPAKVCGLCFKDFDNKKLVTHCTTGVFHKLCFDNLISALAYSGKLFCPYCDTEIKNEQLTASQMIIIENVKKANAMPKMKEEGKPLDRSSSIKPVKHSVVIPQNQYSPVHSICLSKQLSPNKCLNMDYFNKKCSTCCKKIEIGSRYKEIGNKKYCHLSCEPDKHLKDSQQDLHHPEYA